MNELNERDIVRRMRGLAEVTVEGGRTLKALVSARAEIRRRQMLRWTTLGGIAAAMIIAATLGWFMLSPRAATAAEALAAAVDGTNQFKGWIHMTQTVAGAKDTYTSHTNSEIGMLAAVNTTGDKFHVRLFDPVKLEAITYDSAEGKVTIEPWSGEFAANLKQSMQNDPYTVAGALGHFKNIGVDVTVKQTVENGLDRFDLIYSADTEQKAREQNRTMLPTAATLWSDPATRRIVRTSTAVAGQVLNSTITYGGPEIHDVYDLGVPRDAVVVDNMPRAGAKELLTRLGKRSEEGLGDFTGVEAQVTNGVTSLIIYGAAGKSCAMDRYLLSAKSLPDGWPTPSLEAALAAAGKNKVASLFAYDGWQAWHGDIGHSKVMVPTEIPPERVSETIRLSCLPAHLWQSDNLMVGSDDWKSQGLSDPARPGLVGLQIDCLYYTKTTDDTRLHEVFWIDPAKDDLPVEDEETYTNVQTGRVDRAFHETFGGFARTANGKWYPTERQKVADMKLPGQKPQTTESHLQVWTDKTLGAEWFKPPSAP